MFKIIFLGSSKRMPLRETNAWCRKTWNPNLSRSSPRSGRGKNFYIHYNIFHLRFSFTLPLSILLSGTEYFIFKLLAKHKVIPDKINDKSCYTEFCNDFG